MLGRMIVGGVGRTTVRFVAAVAPLLAWWPAWGAADALWRAVLVELGQGGTATSAYRLAYAAWPSAALGGPACIMALALLLRRWRTIDALTAAAAVAGLGAAAVLTGWHELARLLAYRPTYPWSDILRVADLDAGFACALGLLGAGTGLRVLAGKPLRSRDLAPVTRATTDTFGHADWMPMPEAMALFDAARAPLGGVVVGEAYRVDRDRGTKGTTFDPRDRTTWGQGGTAPLLTFDLSWGGTHGLVFAGSGSYKTVSTCVPTLLTYRGPTVTLDPSAELAPMLTKARSDMGRTVVRIDPVTGSGAFNALDWLDRASPLIDGDIRAVVDWICGEKPPATATGAGSGKAFFEGRGKAMVEALLADIVLDPALTDADRTLRSLARRLALPEAAMREELARIHAQSASLRARHLAGQLMALVAETFSGVYGNMSEQTEWLANPAYAALVSGSTFRTADLVAGDLDLFLTLPMKVMESTPALARVVLGALLNAVYEADGVLPGGRVVFLLDEVARLGFMSALARARDAGRKYGITLVMLYQSEGQLREQWGEGGTAAWFESASWRAYAAIGSLEQARAVSEACGEHGVMLASESTSSGRSGRMLDRSSTSSGTSAQLSERGRRLVTSSEILADTRADEQFVFVRGRKPIRCGRALYFRRPALLAQVDANRFAPGAAAAPQRPR